MKTRIEVKGLKELEKALNPESIVNEALKNQIDLTCPSCKKAIKVNPGLNECPHCHQKINLSVNIHD